MREFFLAGGWGMYPTLVFGLLMVGVGSFYAARPERRFVPLLGALGILTLAAGSLGFVTGVMKSFTAAAHYEPGDLAAALAMKGTAESLCNIALALVLTVFAAVAVSLGAWRLARTQPGEPAALMRS
jgi:hypothetical protein